MVLQRQRDDGPVARCPSCPPAPAIAQESSAANHHGAAQPRQRSPPSRTALRTREGVHDSIRTRLHIRFDSYISHRRSRGRTDRREDTAVRHEFERGPRRGDGSDVDSSGPVGGRGDERGVRRERRPIDTTAVASASVPSTPISLIILIRPLRGTHSPVRALYVRRRTSRRTGTPAARGRRGRPFGARKLLPCRPHNRLITFITYNRSVRPTEKEFQMSPAWATFFTLILNLGFSAGSSGFQVSGSGGGVPTPA